VKWDKEGELMDKREKYLEREDKPYADGYYVCWIGWTNNTHEEVNRAFEDAKQVFGLYSLFNNCQHFLKQFAAKIIDPRYRAADYGWFKDNVESEYQKLLKLPPTQEIVDFQLKMLTEAMRQRPDHVSTRDQAHLHDAAHRETQAVVGRMLGSHIAQDQNSMQQQIQIATQIQQQTILGLQGSTIYWFRRPDFVVGIIAVTEATPKWCELEEPVVIQEIDPDVKQQATSLIQKVNSYIFKLQ
jgi:hypothetical protein